MTIGIDTTFLVELEILEHPGHVRAEDFLYRRLDEGDSFALTGQVLTEFLHVVTDPARFARPIVMEHAVSISRMWWSAREVVQVHPDSRTQDLFFKWLLRSGLGRKRLLDTMLAAVYVGNGIADIVSSNTKDFAIFEDLSVIVP